MQIEQYALCLIEKKKLQVWRKFHHCDTNVILSFDGKDIYAKCSTCGEKTNLSLGK